MISGGQSAKTGESFADSLQENVAWAVFPLLLHKGAPALKGIKSKLIDPLFARKNLAEETMTELNKAKILAQLGKKQMSQEVLDKLNTKLKTLKRNETIKMLDEEAELVAKKESLSKDISTYIGENRIGKKAQLPISSVSSGSIENFNAIGDKVIVVNKQ